MVVAGGFHLLNLLWGSLNGLIVIMFSPFVIAFYEAGYSPFTGK